MCRACLFVCEVLVSLYVCSACLLYMCSDCILYVQCLSLVCAVLVSYMCRACLFVCEVLVSLYVCSACLLYMCSDCILYVYSACIFVCAILVSYMYVQCFKYSTFCIQFAFRSSNFGLQKCVKIFKMAHRYLALFRGHVCVKYITLSILYSNQTLLIYSYKH